MAIDPAMASKSATLCGFASRFCRTRFSEHGREAVVLGAGCELDDGLHREASVCAAGFVAGDGSRGQEPYEGPLGVAQLDVLVAERVERPFERRGHDDGGLRFYTNYESRKGRELDANPHAAAVFYWAALDRQVRVEGNVERLTPAESDAYFATRPRGHRLSAWASRQSTAIPDRAYLEARMREAEQRFQATTCRGCPTGAVIDRAGAFRVLGRTRGPGPRSHRLRARRSGLARRAMSP